MTAAAMLLRAAADGRVAADCRALLVELLRPAAPSPPGPSGHSNFALHRESAPIVGGWEPTHKCGKIPRIPEVLKVLGTAKHKTNPPPAELALFAKQPPKGRNYSSKPLLESAAH